MASRILQYYMKTIIFRFYKIFLDRVHAIQLANLITKRKQEKNNKTNRYTKCEDRNKSLKELTNAQNTLLSIGVNL